MPFLASDPSVIGSVARVGRWRGRGWGYGGDYMAWFAGFAPASNPRFLMAVVINEPAGMVSLRRCRRPCPCGGHGRRALQLFAIRPDAIPARGTRQAFARTEANKWRTAY